MPICDACPCPQRHRLVSQIEAATAYTIFVPTNRSLEAQTNSSNLVRSRGWGPPWGEGEPPIPWQRDTAADTLSRALGSPAAPEILLPAPGR